MNEIEITNSLLNCMDKQQILMFTGRNGGDVRSWHSLKTKFMKRNILLLIPFLFYFFAVNGQDSLTFKLIFELDSIHYYDQIYREKLESVESKFGVDSREFGALWDTINHIDSINVVKVTKMIDTYGWLGKNIIGEKGNKTLFLVIQHADSATQRKYIPIMRKAVDEGNAEAREYAMLYDRVLLGEGKKQLYGTQVAMRDSGKCFVLPLEDPDNVDIIRAKVGLGPISEYLKIWNIIWDIEEYKKQQNNQ